jgi:hypothetical protein
MALVASMVYFAISVLAITVPQTGALPDKSILHERNSKSDEITSSIEEKNCMSERSKQDDEAKSRHRSPHLEASRDRGKG